LLDSLVQEGGVEINRIFPGLDDPDVEPEEIMHQVSVDFQVPLRKSLVAKSLSATAILQFQKPTSIKYSIGTQAGASGAGDSETFLAPLEGDIVIKNNHVDQTR
jgi:hypothetical protein